MMWMRRTAGVLSLALVAACAGGSPAAESAPEPERLDPTGTYTFNTYVQDTPVNGRMRIAGEAGEYSGAIYTDFTGELPITSLDVDGRLLRITASTPDGPVDIQLTLEDDATYTGTWSLGAMTGTIQGRRLR